MMAMIFNLRTLYFTTLLFLSADSGTATHNLSQRINHLEEVVVNLTKLVNAHLTKPTKTECPRGYTTIIGHLRSCYKFVTSTSDWYEAGKLCAQEGATLLEIDSEDEDEYIRMHLVSDKALRGKSFFNGGNDIGTEGVYKWFPSGRAVGVAKWFPGQPTKGKTENCIMFYYSTSYERYDWYDGSCYAKLGRICKILM